MKKIVVAGALKCVGLVLAASACGLASAVPIAYEGALTSGVTTGGFVNDPSLTGSPNDDFWFFSANQGDVITIAVQRLNSALDPATILYQGVGADTAALVQVAQADDNMQELPGFSGPFADPFISYTVVNSGQFTLQVWDFLSGPQVPGGFCYQVTLNGTPTSPQFGCQTVAEPGSLALAGIALLGVAGLRRSKKGLAA